MLYSYRSNVSMLLLCSAFSLYVLDGQGTSTASGSHFESVCEVVDEWRVLSQAETASGYFVRLLPNQRFYLSYCKASGSEPYGRPPTCAFIDQTQYNATCHTGFTIQPALVFNQDAGQPEFTDVRIPAGCYCLVERYTHADELNQAISYSINENSSKSSSAPITTTRRNKKNKTNKSEPFQDLDEPNHSKSSLIHSLQQNVPVESDAFSSNTNNDNNYDRMPPKRPTLNSWFGGGGTRYN